MARAADYLTFSTTQVETNYKLRTRSIGSQRVTVTNTAEFYRITVLIEDTFDGSNISPNQIILEPGESKTFTITYDVNFLETLPKGLIPAKINFTATAEVIYIPPPPPPPPPPIDPPPPLVFRGCTNPSALNYSSRATQDDGSCIPKVFGCTIRTSVNYNPLANIDDGSCVTRMDAPPPPQERGGCTIVDSLNYDPTAYVNDGSCIPIIRGCKDPSALNYNGRANIDAECIPRPTDEVVLGCTDATALNYNPRANRDDGTCIPKIIKRGCTNPIALNYDASAEQDDGSCEYTTPPSDIFGCTDNIARNYNKSATKPCKNVTDNDCCEYDGPLAGCKDKNASNYNPNAVIDDGSCIYPPIIGCMDPTAKNYNSQATEPCRVGYDPRAIRDSGLTNSRDRDCCEYDISGCTSPIAVNYNSSANVDDGSCVYIGCTNPAARNYNSSPNIVGCPNDICCDLDPCGGVPQYPCALEGQIVEQGVADENGYCVVCRYVSATGQCATGCDTRCAPEYCGKMIGDPLIDCMDRQAINYNPAATEPCDFGCCQYDTFGCMDSAAKNYNPAATKPNPEFPCTYDVRGCTDPAAKNYMREATLDDGSCIPVNAGCTDSTAYNYNSKANVDDGSCYTCPAAGTVISRVPIGIGTPQQYVVGIANGNCTNTYEYVTEQASNNNTIATGPSGDQTTDPFSGTNTGGGGGGELFVETDGDTNFGNDRNTTNQI